MNRIRVSAQVFLFFLMMIFMMATVGCGGSDNTPLPKYSQSDLTGTWHAYLLTAGTTSEWQTVTVTFSSSGTLSFSDCLNNTANTSCPTNTIVWTINGSNGVISETSDGTATNSHFTMTSNKNFISGTGSSGGGTGSQMIIALKEGTSYTGTELNSQSLVYHELAAGVTNQWIYGIGTTDGSDNLNISSFTDPSGTHSSGGSGTLSVNTSGDVTLSSVSSFHGFLSDDKKTIVGVLNYDPSSPALIIFQVTTGQTVDTGSLPGTTFYGHELACGVSPAPFWDHETISVDILGGITLGDFVSSSPSVTAPTGPFTGSVSDSSGTIAISGIDQYNGHISYDGNFVVGTQTDDTGVYALSIMTR